METFPAPSKAGSIYGFSDDYTDEAVQVADYASGYPVANKLFTFVPRNFPYVLPLVTDAEKADIDAFYLANMALVFYWLNPKDKLTYQTIFTAPPKAVPITTGKWRVIIELRQANSTVT